MALKNRSNVQEKLKLKFLYIITYKCSFFCDSKTFAKTLYDLQKRIKSDIFEKIKTGILYESFHNND